ncbi:alpha/beta hydrolase [Rhodococcus sp. WMMA185]|uniref:alpha/beta fold hydrolase n=1 Tax=Rhodococcus sp. WMMA185 TaxID=679318 RepID=UPI00087917CF|nr:alpha/beta hydrolase [Rhodococcus sp. WMMA185]AOW92253.1 alpha/beta hydrolase [Rhodococcus sp. WMMA185]
MGHVSALHTHLFGAQDGPEILALHGLTGHGRRWEAIADGQLPDARWISPDLRGHGLSTWAPPWNLEAHVSSLIDTLDAHAHGPVLVVGHSFGGALGLHLARAVPDRITGLVLLDPAIGLDPELMRTVADLTISSPDYTDVDEARSEKLDGAWGEVPRDALEIEIAEHLVPLDNGRVNWRLSTPAVVSAWGELARDPVLPPEDLPTVLVQASKVQPPYVTPAFRRALTEHLGENLTAVDIECDHMVAQARPDDVAAIIRKLL